MVAFVGSFLVIFLMIGIVVWYGNKRPAPSPVTWGEAMLGAVLAFFGLFWAFGVVPQAWILWSANELKWRPDHYLTGPNGTLLKGPISFSMAGLGDLITVGIYTFMLTAYAVLVVFWNRRAQVQAKSRRTKELRGGRRGLLARKGQLS